MKKIFTIAMLSLFTLPMLVAQNNVTVDAGASWLSAPQYCGPWGPLC